MLASKPLPYMIRFRRLIQSAEWRKLYGVLARRFLSTGGVMYEACLKRDVANRRQIHLVILAVQQTE
jgi:hypothetical protein